MPDGGDLVFSSRREYLGKEKIRNKGLSCQKGAYITISISDTGQGMSTETLNQALEPFFTTKPQGAGTGMGLSPERELLC